MQPYDFVMIAVMGGAILFGLWKGFAWQVASLTAIIASYLVARNFNEPVANMIGGDPAWNRFLAMFILFMGTSLVIWIGFGFVRSSIEKMHLKSFDRQAGAALGAVKGAIVCTIITLFACSLLGDQVCRAICTSRSGNYIARGLTHVGSIVPEEIAKHINPYIDNFQKEVEEHQNENPGWPNQGQPGGFFPTGNPGTWGNPDMTRNDGPTERVGQLQPAADTQWQPPQPVYNGTTGQWEYPQGQPAPQSAPQPPTNTGGQFQLPQIDWRSAAQKAAEDAANQIFNPGGGNQ